MKSAGAWLKNRGPVGDSRPQALEIAAERRRALSWGSNPIFRPQSEMVEVIPMVASLLAVG